MTGGGGYELDRFVEAQNHGMIYEQARRELLDGYKTSHWMWFVFPELAGLGSSAMSRRYAIGSFEEARAYLAHPILGPRLVDCAEIIAVSERPSAEAIFGSVDAVKLRSSMTLFQHADPKQRIFTTVLDRYFDGQQDRTTVELLPEH
jgi:uncharacterized protein (DUF1810 family)